MKHLWDDLKKLHDEIFETINDTNRWEKLPLLTNRRGNLMRLLADLIDKGLLPAASNEQKQDLFANQKKLETLMQEKGAKMKTSFKITQKYQTSVK